MLRFDVNIPPKYPKSWALTHSKMTLHAVKVDLPELKQGDITNNYEWYGDIFAAMFCSMANLLGTLLKMMSLGWALSSPHWRLEMEWFTQPQLDLATGQTKTTWGWSSGEPENSPGRTWNDPSKWAKKHWEVWKKPRAQRHELDMTHANPCETSQVWISSNTYQ